MNSWRISKYNPAFRNERGAYLKDEWTSVSDIGKSFDGEVLTLEEYRRIESAYVSTALSFLSETGLEALTIKKLETYGILELRVGDLWGITFDPKLCREGMVISGDTLTDVCRLVLREVIWCNLESDNSFHINFGFDYYMYVSSSIRCEKSIAYGKQQGLFVEDMETLNLFEGEA